MIRRYLATTSRFPKIRVNQQFLDELGQSTKEGKKVNKGRFTDDMPELFKPPVNTAAINNYIDAYLSRMNTSSIVTLFSTAYANKFRLTDSHIQSIAEVLQESHSPLKPKQVSNVIRNLGLMKGPSPAVRLLLTIAADDIEKTSTPLVPLSPRNICSILFGLRGMDCTIPEVKRLLNILQNEIASSTSEFCEADIALITQWLQTVPTHLPEVRALIRVVVVRMHDTNEQYSARNISGCLYALKNSSSSVDEIRMFVNAVLNHWHDNTAITMSEGDIAMCLLGLRNMSGMGPEEKQVFDKLAEQVEKLDDVFALTSVVNIVYGFKGKVGLPPELRRLMRALTTKIHATDMKSQQKYTHHGRLCNDPTTLALLFKGLHRLNPSKSSASRELLGALADRLSFELASATSGQLHPVKLNSDTLRGMMFDTIHVTNTFHKWDPVNLQSNPTIKEAERLVLLLSNMIRAVPNRAFITPAHLCPIAQSIKNLQLPPLESMVTEDDHAEVRQLLSSLADAFEETVAKVEEGQWMWTCDELSTAVHGLRGMSGSYPEVRRLLRLYIGLMRGCATRATGETVLTPRGLTNIVHGLAEKSMDQEEVADTVEFVLQQLRAIETSGKMESIQLVASQYCLALSGLSGLDSDDQRVRALISYLNKIATTDDGWPRFEGAVAEKHSVVSFATMLRSVRCLKTDSPEVRQLLKIISGIIARASRDRPADKEKRLRGLFMAFYYLRDMSASSVTQVEDVLLALTKALMDKNKALREGKTPPRVSAAEMCHLVSGLRSTDTDQSNASRLLLGELTQVLKEQKVPSEIGVLCATVGSFHSTSRGSDVLDAFLSALAEKFPSGVEQILVSDMLHIVRGLRYTGDNGKDLWDKFVNTALTVTRIEDEKDALIEIVDILNSEQYAQREGAAKLVEALLQK